MRHLAVVLAVVAVGCGGDDEASPVARTQPPVGAPAATATPEPTPSPTASAAPSPTATPTPVEEQQGGAGDEEAPRVPVRFTIDGEGITPPQVSVPAFFPLELTVHNDLSETVTVVLDEVRVRAEAGGRGRGRHPGLPNGRHTVDAGAAGEAVIVAGAEPGP